MTDERLIVGYDSDDDASVYVVSPDIAIVQTIDFFPPVVDDPYDFGRIAAANALSDVYAMGAVPKTALNVLCFPSCLDHGIMKRILEGGADKCMEAGVVITGGHSLDDEEPKYGLSVMGLCHPSAIRRNDTPRPGDVLILTKPLGTGALSTAAKAGLIEDTSHIELLTETMARLNRVAAELSMTCDVSASTDITGFGLLGHANEMAGKDQRVTLVFESRNLPLLPSAEAMAKDGILPGGCYRNRAYAGSKVAFEDDVPLALSDLMFDPQTSGGLLLAMKPDDAPRYMAAMQEAGENVWQVGEVSHWNGISVRVI